MSSTTLFELMDASGRAGLEASDLVVLWHMARRCCGIGGTLDGECYSSWTAITTDTGRPRRTVARSLARLVASGWLTEVGHRGQVKVYRCQVGTGATMAPVPPWHPPSATMALDQCHHGTGPVPPWHPEEAHEGALEEALEEAHAPEGAVCVPPDDDPGLSGEPQGEQPREDLDNGPPKDPPRQPTLPSLPAPKPAKKADNRKPSKAIQRDEAVARCLAEWNVHAEKAWRFRHKSLPAKTRSAIAARIDEHDEASVIEVVRWWWTSKSDRASFLRTGGHELPTIVRPEKFATYLDLARQPDAPSVRWRGEHPAQQAGPESPAKHPDMLDEDEFERMAAAFLARPSIEQEIDAKLAARRGVTP
jgi:hypothetical protein